ncbi:hypothetical protein RFI_21370, partial [Reticulomyxa filosa]
DNEDNKEGKWTKEKIDKNESFGILKSFFAKNNIIESDEAMKKEFENREPTFKIIWISVILGKMKIIKSALLMIAINLSNLKQLFEQELNYEVACNPFPKMTEDDVNEFIEQVKFNFKTS